MGMTKEDARVTTQSCRLSVWAFPMSSSETRFSNLSRQPSQ